MSLEPIFMSCVFFFFLYPLPNNFPVVNQTLPKNEQIEKMLLIDMLFWLVCLLIYLSYHFYGT